MATKRSAKKAAKRRHIPAKKSAKKSAPPPRAAPRRATGVPFTGKSDPRNGRGPAPGAPNAGRPPNAYKELCADIADRGMRAIVTKKVMENPKHPAFMPALKTMLEHAHGKPRQAVELTGPGGGPVQTEDVTDARAAMRQRLEQAAKRHTAAAAGGVATPA